MREPSTAVFFFCADLGRDPVALHVFAAMERELGLTGTAVEVDGYEVMLHSAPEGDRCLLVRLDDVLSYDYRRYLPVVRRLFGAAQAGVVVNWHEGANAPDRIFTVHTTGDVSTGQFGPASPTQMSALLLTLERERVAAGLDDFTTRIEGTHWSGVTHGSDPTEILKYPVPLLDVEIGSLPGSWSNPVAARVVARSLPQVFQSLDARTRSVLCLGGVHFEQGFLTAVIPGCETHPLALSHVLPNHWLASGEYGTSAGLDRLRRCAASITGGVHLVAFHDSLKSAYKELARGLASELGVPAVSHKKLRIPAELPIW